MIYRPRRFLPQLFPSEEEDGFPLVELPDPFIYYPFNGDVVNYGSSGAPNNGALQGTGSSYVEGSLPDKQALRLTTASYLQIGGGFVPMPGTGDCSLSAHIKVTDVSGNVFLLSAHRNSNNRGVELYAFDVASSEGRSHAYAMSDPAAVAYSIGGTIGRASGHANQPDWNTSQVILDRLGAQLAKASVDGLIGPTTSDISAAANDDMFQATFGSVIGYIGSRVNTFSTFITAVDIAEWAWFTEALSEAQTKTLHQLRLNGTPLGEYQGLF